LRVFLIASAGILLAGAVLLSGVLSSRLKEQTIADARTSLTQYVDGVLRPELVDGNRVVVRRGLTQQLAAVGRRPDIVTVKVWRLNGVLAWTNRARSRIGHRFDLDGNLGVSMKSNRSVAEIEVPDTEENQVERHVGFGRLLEVYAPIRNAGGHAIGAYEIYADPKPTEHAIAANNHLIWGAVAAVFLALYLALALLVRTASRTLRRQASSLTEAYAVLEQNALEAVETLNATVDARDPYTAGHSQRVQEIALAIADELGIESKEREAIALAGLFHDIGKLGVPDAILTKPAKLTTQEYELMKQHPADGANIIAKFSRLQEAVPMIHHHHERWDGAGYPDRLAAEAIPFGATIVGLADAWDAMTTDRPYHRALERSEAEAELRDNRGTQFEPAVVDAFFRALGRNRIPDAEPQASASTGAVRLAV
jgi:putative nucleotidyltransferase with HDIG domain